MLVNLLVDRDRSREISVLSGKIPSLVLSSRNVCDLELLANGGFSPLRTFMTQKDYLSVLEKMELSDGTFWPLPITLTANPEEIPKVGELLALRSECYDLLAVMKLEEIFSWDQELEGKYAYGTTDIAHPMVSEMRQWKKLCISGPLEVLSLPQYFDFCDLRRTPGEVREELQKLGFQNIVAFQTRNPMHRAHEELTKRAAERIRGALLIHPVVGLTKPGDVDHFTRTRCYKAMYDRYYDKSKTILSLLPLAMRMAGPKEALLHAIIRRNYGATHFIVGRDHAGPGNDSKGNLFYGPYDAQETVRKFEDRIGIKMVPFEQLVYVPEKDSYFEEKDVPEGALIKNISGTQVRNDYLAKGIYLPYWFTRPECAQILAQTYPPRSKQGFCIWLTGLSGSGKSSIAKALVAKIFEQHGRQVTLLDGDVIRTHLSKGLSFSKEDRRLNILRIAFVAAEICRHNGYVIVAAISPHEGPRREARACIGANFIEVFVNTPIQVCEERDAKGLYNKARVAMAEGKGIGFTGVDDIYEPPASPEVSVTGFGQCIDISSNNVLEYLKDKGFLEN